MVSAAARGGESFGGDYVAEVTQVFEFRVAVESTAARLAAERSGVHDLDLLEECQLKLRASTDVDTFRRADSEFHLSVARMSHNAMLERSIEDARAAAFSWPRPADSSPVFHDSSIRGHAAIIDAIAHGDGTAAAAAMTAHIEEARGEVLEKRSAARPRPDVEASPAPSCRTSPYSGPCSRPWKETITSSPGYGSTLWSCPNAPHRSRTPPRFR